MPFEAMPVTIMCEMASLIKSTSSFNKQSFISWPSLLVAEIKILHIQFSNLKQNWLDETSAEISSNFPDFSLR